MTTAEIIECARGKAAELHWPWSEEHVAASRLLRLWPGPRFWKVVSRIPQEGAQVTVIVNASSREAWPRCVVYHAKYRSAPRTRP